ncbi:MULTISPECIES: DUF262 domain-containing protein [Pseudomonas]|uniref:DUF262 domain-containing protein n=1 Tax=Pseudomonas TaxID=286 RepID=UPI001F46E3B6|nr:DUF262 domain-containing protein [Pseudomonas fulva]
MSIMQQSSKAQDRTLGVWFQSIQQGQVKLPRFQRFEAWDRNRVTGFLNTIINNLPVGVTLALEVGHQEKFESRYISTAEPAVEGRVNQHLLDGQQRLTAFWRSMHNNYKWETYFVYLPQFDRYYEQPGDEVEVCCIPRWINKNGLRMPRWADDSRSSFERGFVPISLLRPGDLVSEIDAWLASATNHLRPSKDDPELWDKMESYNALREQFKNELNTLRERVTHFNLPYLSLPADTSKEVALQVFINMNTNSKPLSLYDIIVAEVENVAGRSLHELQVALHEKCPHVSRYSDLSDLILSTSALLQDKIPNTRGMVEMSKQLMLDNWLTLERGLGRMAALLASQGVYDAARLPTNAVLAVIAASYALIPEHGDFLGNAEKLLRRYLWSSFFTDRYENSAASRAFADFKAMKMLLQKQDFKDEDLASVPVLDRAQHPLATLDELMSAGWPKGTGIEARAIMAVTTYLGAVDFADHKMASYESLQKREYHHVFPDALLAEAKIPSYLALNCALITWKTNRSIGRKDPLDYLKDRVDWAGEDTVRKRLKTHLIDYEVLAKAHYGVATDEAFEKRLNADFTAFLHNRARLVEAAMQQLAGGESTDVTSLWSVIESVEEAVL